MGRILLIEPRKILRQAIILSLFPEHEVLVEENLAAAQLSSLKEYDLLIVDGASLRESEPSMAEITRAVQGCRTPTVWLEDAAASQAPKREKLLVVKKPLERESFQSAVNDFLSGDSGPKKITKASSPAVSVRAAAPKRETTKKTDAFTDASTEQGSFGFIDLVEVVEEKGSPKRENKPTRKSK